MYWVVDTNVARVANAPHDGTHASPECVLACIAQIKEVVKSGGLLLDDAWHIIREYQANLRSTGQPGVGDAFLRVVLTRYRDPTWCKLVPITPHPDRGFEEFPDDPRLSTFDKSDRKLVAVSLGGPRPNVILNAVDTDWYEHREALSDNGVEVRFLCPSAMPGGFDDARHPPSHRSRIVGEAKPAYAGS